MTDNFRRFRRDVELPQLPILPILRQLQMQQWQTGMSAPLKWPMWPICAVCRCCRFRIFVRWSFCGEWRSCGGSVACGRCGGGWSEVVRGSQRWSEAVRGSQRQSGGAWRCGRVVCEGLRRRFVQGEFWHCVSFAFWYNTSLRLAARAGPTSTREDTGNGACTDCSWWRGSDGARAV